MNRFEEIYNEAKADKWFRRFAVFCRVFLAVTFLIAGYVKVIGERFAEGLPFNNPLGHYFYALHETSYYYTFIGIGQIAAAILLLIPRTALLGALMYFPIMINIVVLTYATRFAGTRAVTFALLANLFLLVWEYERLKYVFLLIWDKTYLKQILPFAQARTEAPVITKPLRWRLRAIFFGGSFALLAFIIFGTFYLFEIGPGNSEEECRNQCAGSKNPAACQDFCDCIYKQGQPLDSCLAKYDKTTISKTDAK
ncbi:DoxX family protein [Emticicia sp. BO119]|uniref:DoxX family protein n=1 Tax=Emticicia sp. BO119 TaxID=2757768 RepID=UPI0015F07177|nr:DoxX family protein [Emticicia sp. BO119]MBA4851281.1 DoxX family protein [Emticicia sp. BO119]